MMRMVSFDDAEEKLRNAEDFLRKHNFADAILNTQISVELAVKCLFDALNIKYKLVHDIDDACYDEAFNRLPHLVGKDYYLANDISTKVARARVLLASLSSMRNYAEYGVSRVSAKNIFSSAQMEDLAEAYHGCANEIFFELTNLARYVRELK
jgi:hypothetical protein